jgi:simple sugar transport system substrate-binding protein
MSIKMTRLASLLLLAAMLLAACTPAATATPTSAPQPTSVPPTDVPAEEPFVFGLIMVGPQFDHGWNEAHWEAAQYVLEHVPNTKLEWIDKVNQADRPGVTIEQVSEDMISKGARVIFTNSAEFKDGTNNAAAAHPDVTFIHISGDAVLDGSAPPNVGNFMGQMEYGKMMAGCAAALTSQTGSIAYLGPLIDPETRRLVNSAYLGARYCWENYRGMDAADLKFAVTWIGFWFNIPGVTLDPTQVANDFFNGGADVILSGIDTTEGLVVAGQRAAADEQVWSIPYDYLGGCAEAPAVCLGVPYFNWGPDYLQTIEGVMNGTWKQEWEWNGPDWSDINNPDTSAVGWVHGEALSADNRATLDQFIAGLADGSINLWQGPLNFQDGTVFAAEGATASDDEIWYTPQLLEGIEGTSQ